jgi:fructose-1,6-bisphosphatase II
MSEDVFDHHLTETFANNLSMYLVRVTEVTALAAGRWMGRGDREAADRAATRAMSRALQTLDIDGNIAIGEEGRLGEHTNLDTGEKVGTGKGPTLDVVLDPIDGVNLLARSLPDSISVIGMTPKGAMWHPAPAAYMEKLVVDRRTAKQLVPECLDAPAAWTLALVARAKQKPVSDLLVYILKRPRHEDLIEEICAAGARVLLRSDGDIAGALMAASDRFSVDVMMGIGGAAEGVIAACAVKSMGGEMLGRLSPQTEEESSAVAEAGLDTSQILTCDQMIKGDEIYFATTSITDGALLEGVHYHGHSATTQSLVLRSRTGTERIIYTAHQLPS